MKHLETDPGWLYVNGEIRSVEGVVATVNRNTPPGDRHFQGRVLAHSISMLSAIERLSIELRRESDSERIHEIAAELQHWAFLIRYGEFTDD